jgi:hypothetical protein
MVQVIQANSLLLSDVEARFSLQEIWDSHFFLEWQQDLPEITDAEKQWLDQIKVDFLGLAKSSPHEEITKLFVLAPLLSLAGLARPPFLPVAEQSVEIFLENDDEVIRGKIDLMVLHRRLWAIVIESKRSSLNVLEALPQALLYMMARPLEQKPIFGLMLNGTEFLFVKVQQDSSQYALSRLYSLINPGNDLYEVLGVLRQLRTLVLAT